MERINIGDWVTQYRAGYWKVKELHPKYSPFDHGRLHKGEPIGIVAVLQKAFSNTFKFNMEMSTCDLSLCQHVTKAVTRKIETYYRVGQGHYCPLPPSEPYVRVSPHTAQAFQSLCSCAETGSSYFLFPLFLRDNLKHSS